MERFVQLTRTEKDRVDRENKSSEKNHNIDLETQSVSHPIIIILATSPCYKCVLYSFLPLKVKTICLL